MRSRFEWRLRTTSLTLGERTLVMGILNATPDSFSDGGKWLETQAAVEHGLDLLSCGADILDIGGESTRPGAAPAAATEEQSRVLPVIRGILRWRPDAVVSVDTYRAETARLALAAGAQIVNDVSGGLWDAGMRSLWASERCGVVVMHTRGRPHEWRTLPALAAGDVVPLVTRELRLRTDEALAAGVERKSMAVDPGFGFGKSLDENWPLLAGVEEIARLGFPVLAGVSRKGFLRHAMESCEPEMETGGVHAAEPLRDAGIAANTAAILAGAHIIRVHDVVAARRAVAVADRVLTGAAPA